MAEICQGVLDELEMPFKGALSIVVPIFKVMMISETAVAMKPVMEPVME